MDLLRNPRPLQASVASPMAVPRAVPLRREQVAETHVVRFDHHQRLQHVLMMSSFIVLPLAGLPQKFGDLALSQWWVNTLGGLETVRAIHRTAGFVMLGDCLYLLCYLRFRMGVQRQLGPLRMVPSPKGVRDVLQSLLHFVGAVVLAVGWAPARQVFNPHLATWIFPFNSSIFPGKVSARRYAAEHPLEWARIASAGPAPKPLPAQTPAGAPT